MSYLLVTRLLLGVALELLAPIIVYLAAVYSGSDPAKTRTGMFSANTAVATSFGQQQTFEGFTPNSPKMKVLTCGKANGEILYTPVPALSPVNINLHNTITEPKT